MTPWKLFGIPDRKRTERIEPQRRIPLFHQPDRVVGHLLRRITHQVHVHADPLARRASQQPVYRKTSRLAGDVPQRYINCADCGHRVGTSPEQTPPEHVLPVALDLRRIFAYQVLGTVLDRGPHSERRAAAAAPAVQVSDAGEPLVGCHLDPLVDRGAERFYLGDLHWSLPLLKRIPLNIAGQATIPNRLSKPVPGSIPHRRTGEGRYPGDGRGNPHNRHPPPTPHFPTTVVPAKERHPVPRYGAGTQGTGAATTQPSSPTLTGHPPPTVIPDLIRSPRCAGRTRGHRGHGVSGTVPRMPLPHPETRRHLRRLATSRGGDSFEPYAVYETSATYTSPCESIAIPWGARN